jgi:membrane associated rhomboid family serine protease/Zn-finger nucleic acid-binding protein
METEFFCPRCNLPLKQVRMTNGLFWACDTCAGRAVGLELLRRTFTPESINPLWLHAISDEGKIGCRCPSCAHAMIQVALSENAGINVDVCRLCHFVWFDMHEVEALVPRPLPSAPVEMPQAAREAIAMLKVQELAEQARGPDFDSAPPDERWKQIAAFLGMPIEFDAARQERRPWATWLLCILIIGISTFAFTGLHEVVARFGLIPAEATRFGGLTFLTSFFLHAGIIHLIGNMYFLFVFGDDVENFLRPFRYFALIVLAAFVGDLAHVAADPHSQIPCVGASGGIAGVITFYALNFPEMKLGFLLRYGWWWFRWIRLRAWFVFVLWILFQAVGAWEQVAGISAVSSLAHIGGAIAGFVAWLLWRKDNRATEVSRL